MRFLRTQKVSGFSLLQAMLGLGLVSMTALAIAAIAENSARQMKVTQLSSDWIQLASNFKNILNGRDSCRNALTGRVFNPTAAFPQAVFSAGSQVLAPNGTPLFQIVSNSSRNGVMVRGIQFTSSDSTLTSVPAGMTGHLVNLRIFAERSIANSAVATADRSYQNDFKVNIITNAQHQIVDCYGPVSEGSLCNSLGGVFNSTASVRCQVPFLPKKVLVPFSSDAYFKVPPGVSSIAVTVIGGGGGGGAGTSGPSGGGGGGGGYVYVPNIRVDAGDFYLIKIGKGGTPGNSGTTSSFGESGSDLYISAGGGLPGRSSSSANLSQCISGTNISAGNTGGAGGSTSMTLPSATPTAGIQEVSREGGCGNTFGGGNGGTSAHPQGSGEGASAPGVGGAGFAPGAGGGGGRGGSNAGGAGATGYVMVEY